MRFPRQLFHHAPFTAKQPSPNRRRRSDTYKTEKRVRETQDTGDIERNVSRRVIEMNFYYYIPCGRAMATFRCTFDERGRAVRRRQRLWQQLRQRHGYNYF